MLDCLELTKVDVLSTSKINKTTCWNMYDLCAILDGQNPTLDGMIIPVQPFNYLGYQLISAHQPSIFPITRRLWGPQEDINLTVAFHPTHFELQILGLFWKDFGGFVGPKDTHGWITWDAFLFHFQGVTTCRFRLHSLKLTNATSL